MSLKSEIKNATRPKPKPKKLPQVMARIPESLKREVDLKIDVDRAQGKSMSWQVLIESAARAYVDD